MADRAGLQLIGWLLGGCTAAVMLVAALLVHAAVANPAAAEGPAHAPVAAPVAQH